MEKIEIGKISAAFGIKGELKLLHYSGEHERIEGIEELFLIMGEKEVPHKVKSIRISSKGPIVKLQGVEDRNSAELLIGSKVLVDEELLTPLDDDSLYINDIIGMTVKNLEGIKIGTVKDFIDNPSNPIIDIKAEDGESDFLLPYVDSFIREIDETLGEITIVLPEGIRSIGK